MLIHIMEKRIHDERFLRLIRKFLNAGYMEQGQTYKTYSGTSQGGIISPILANIYLNELNKYVMDYADRFREGNHRKATKEVKAIQFQIAKRKKKLEKGTPEEQERLRREITELEQQRLHIPASDPMQGDYRRMQYVRYADDWLIGVIGSKKDCEQIRREIGDYLRDVLKLELSEEKTLITNAKNNAHFLGYDVHVRSASCPVAYRNKKGVLQRHYTAAVVLTIPDGKIRDKLLEYDAISIRCHDGKDVWKPKGRRDLLYKADLDILDRYNAEIRGIYNYYALAQNCSSLHVFGTMMEYSMYKTLAAKYRCQKSRIISKYSVNGQFCVQFKDEKGQTRQRFFYHEGFKRKGMSSAETLDREPQGDRFRYRTHLVKRLKAGICELCGSPCAERVKFIDDICAAAKGYEYMAELQIKVGQE